MDELLRERRATGMQTELHRLQATIPPEKKGLAAQFEMAATISASPPDWGPRLGLAMALCTILKAVNMNLSYLADELFTHARQKCEEAGRRLPEKKQIRLDSEIWKTYRKQRCGRREAAGQRRGARIWRNHDQVNTRTFSSQFECFGMPEHLAVGGKAGRA